MDPYDIVDAVLATLWMGGQRHGFEGFIEVTRFDYFFRRRWRCLVYLYGTAIPLLVGWRSFKYDVLGIELVE